MTEITCRKCGKSYPDTPEHWYFQNGLMKKPCKECHRAAERARQATYRKTKKAKQIDPRPCRYCGKMFNPKNKNANRRQHCYRAECIVLAHRQYDSQKREATRQWKAKNNAKKSINLKICPLCGKKRYIDPNYPFSCKACRIRVLKNSLCDGNFIYLPSIEEEAHHGAQ